MATVISGAPALAELRQVRSALAGIVEPTPLVPSESLSASTGYPVWLKAENLQRTGSFKLRGAAAKIARLSEAERRRGVIAASAGNHGQGVAFAARLVGAPATIVLPESASATKVSAIQARGARTVLHGASYEEANQQALTLAQTEGLTFIHPFDDWQIIAGQGSVALELLDQLPEVGAMVVPVGGGGLIAGVALAAKTVRPAVQIVGVQAAGAAAAVSAFQTGVRRELPAETIADGIKVSLPGERPCQVLTRLVDAMVTVDEEEIYRAVIFLLETAKLVVEPAGAVGVAALLGGKVSLPPGTSVVPILSGGNVDPNLLLHLIEYGLVHSGRSLLLRVTLPDRPGELIRLLAPLRERRVNVIDIQHRRAIWGLPIGTSEVLLHLETRGPEHCAEVIASLRALNLAIEPLLPQGMGVS